MHETGDSVASIETAHVANPIHDSPLKALNVETALAKVNDESNSERSQEKDAVTGSGAKSTSGFWHAVETCRVGCSCILLLFSLAVLLTLIFSGRRYWLGFLVLLVFFLLLATLGAMEGGQGALVGIRPIKKALYAESHPVAHHCSTVLSIPGNMERFIVGRQLLVVLTLFSMNLLIAVKDEPEDMTTHINSTTTVHYNSRLQQHAATSHTWVPQAIIRSNTCLMIVTIVLGQLMPQVASASCMLDFSNSSFVLLIVYLSLAVESSGLLHATYLVQLLPAFAQGRQNEAAVVVVVEEEEEEEEEEEAEEEEGEAATVDATVAAAKKSAKNAAKKAANKPANNAGSTAPCEVVPTSVPGSSNASKCTWVAFFWCLRALFSVIILVFAFVVTLDALFSGWTAWSGSSTVAVVILFVLMVVVGILEGLQIALFAVYNMKEKEYRTSHPLAHKNVQFVFSGTRLQAFLIGRQILVAVCMFLFAMITKVAVDNEGLAEHGMTILGMGSGMQAFVNTGLLGSLIVTVVGSLVWRVIAASFPLTYLSTHIVTLIVYLCLCLEATGVMSSALPLASVQNIACSNRTDATYLGDECRSIGTSTDRISTVEAKPSFSKNILSDSVSYGTMPRSGATDMDMEQTNPLFREGAL
jgi:VIT1/CCC1 family predicted Fe2+/Mn2+ transporter